MFARRIVCQKNKKWYTYKCFFFRIQSIRVRIASTQRFSGGLEYNATSFNSHPLYDDASSDYDVGVISIAEGMTLDGTNARAINMVGFGSDVADGANVVLTGWGATSVRYMFFFL